MTTETQRSAARSSDTVAVLGGGRIGEALLGGLVAAGRDAGSLLVVERDADRAAEVSGRLGVTATDVADAAGRADVLVVAVKPQDVQGVLESVPAGRERVVVSLAAGIPTIALERWLPTGTPVVRVMPNTPMLVGRAMCVLSAGAHADDAAMDTAEGLLRSVGRTVRVPESQQDAATALSGSGPAYLFLVAEAMIEAGVALGLPRPTATELVTATVDGAGGLLTGPGNHPSLLREAVTSPGGTTAQALRVLEAHGLRAAFADAVEACRDRSQALGATYGG
ncbi:pyrroline-5-carboxylate reductase [Actinomycetospora termitidis]|uniref:Pyrroline-5-carboxylate reductase n=1 Tax=Actinomycetospora termitidis TaxID=3053470 RepID=A0ABT7M3Q7_9PSEU|nr:pyrroline-5-carboxylate reductase [Actinomycetospora sp. Odt1-22]MDL5155305.1 pyrroline-5-carboxylate reductase [Actinomycetospora sp. Odt1-22]